MEVQCISDGCVENNISFEGLWLKAILPSHPISAAAHSLLAHSPIHHCHQFHFPSSSLPPPPPIIQMTSSADTKHVHKSAIGGGKRAKSARTLHSAERENMLSWEMQFGRHELKSALQSGKLSTYSTKRTSKDVRANADRPLDRGRDGRTDVPWVRP